MSNKNRNPFKMRASEKIESDASFLRLFSPEVLQVFLERASLEDLWEKILFIRSSPGAGKSSLLRVFEPGPLSIVYNHRSSQEHKVLYEILKKLDVVSKNRVETLGVSIRCTRNYEILEDLDLGNAQKMRLFYSLLNARIVLASLRAIIDLKKLKFPDDLNRISFEYDNRDNFLTRLTTPCNGERLFEWASGIERQVYEAIDSFLPIGDLKIEGHDELFSLSIITSSNILVDGQEFCNRILFMIDDAHKLSLPQRSSLFNYVIEKRGRFSVWFSERLEAQIGQPERELLGFSSYIGRDYAEINLENFWAKNTGKFKKILAKIATKRAMLSTEEVDSFQENLESQLDETALLEKIEKAINLSHEQISKVTAFSTKFGEWVDYLNKNEIISYERAVLLKQAEILIARNINKSQLSLDFPLRREELTERLDYSIETTAKLFIAKEHDIPFYFGFNDLVSLSSNNIEQFLGFSAELYEGMLANRITGREVQLDAIRQEKILRGVVNKKWEELRTLLPDSRQVLSFIDNLGKYFSEITHKPTASYAPGVNGFAIKEVKTPKLFEQPDWNQDDRFIPILDVIGICLAYNLLEKKETIQGKKGQKWIVYYFNRWLCLRYALPLTFGGWNKITPGNLLKWIKN